jgi:hypothetical protein
MVCLQVSNGDENLQLCRAAANMLNKQAGTYDKQHCVQFLENLWWTLHLQFPGEIMAVCSNRKMK